MFPLPIKEVNMVAQYGFYVNTNECIGCRMCIISCKDKNNLPVGEKFRRVYDYSGGDWTVDDVGVMSVANMFSYAVTSGCHHCAMPKCFVACPTGAIEKRGDGIVWINKELCIACGSCAEACPFNAPYISAIENYARKCDFCKDLIDNGENPVCVNSCQIRCLEYGELEDLKAAHPDAVDVIAPLPEDPGTTPSSLYSRHRMNPDGALVGEVRNSPEEIISETFVETYL
jgi:anaerobic dimethyl sulfoxide reductase subunit B (iron-sulfur subunit)